MRNFLLLIILIAAFGFLNQGKVVDNCKKLEDPRDCWKKELRETVKKRGIDAGFELFGKFNEDKRLTADTCHVLTHVMGEEFYNIKKKSFFKNVNLTGSCGYGFYHGMIYASISKAKNIEDAKTFCWNIYKNSENPKERGVSRCFHGIGHGITDYYMDLGYEVQKAIDSGMLTCEAVSGGDSYPLEHCAIGVFASTASGYFKGIYPREGNNPLSICTKQREKYLKYCYISLSSLIILKNFDFGKSIGEALQFLPVSGENQRLGIETISFVWAMGDLRNDFQNTIKVCQTLTEDLKFSCLRGYISGLISLGKQNLAKGKKFCDFPSLSDGEKRLCYEGYLNMSKRTFDKEVFKKICKESGTFCKI